MSLDCKLNVVINYNGYNRVTIMPNPKTGIQRCVKSDEYVLDNENNFYVADESFNGKPFSYWEVVPCNVDRVIEICSTRKYNYLVNCNCVIRAVYGSSKENIALIGEPTYRKINDNGTSKLRATFTLQYFSSDGVLLSGSLAKDYKVGLLTEFCNFVKITKEDEIGATLLPSEKIKFPESLNTDIAEIEKNIKASKKQFVFDIDGDGKNDKCFNNFSIELNKFNNKNKIDFYVIFPNSEYYRHYVFRAYFYVINDKGEFLMSEPTYFYCYDIGNSR